MSLLNMVAVLVAGWVAPIVVGKPAASRAPVEVAPAEKECPAPVPATRLDLWPREWPLPPLRAPEPDPPKPPGPLPFRVGAGVSADFISNSGGSIGLRLDAGVRLGMFSFEGEGQWDPALATNSFSTINVTGSLRFSRATGALMVCVYPNLLFACLKGQTGEILFSGSYPALPALAYGAAGIQVGLEVPVVPWFLVRLDGELLPTINPASSVVASQTVFQVARFNAGLGLGARFAWGRR